MDACLDSLRFAGIGKEKAFVPNGGDGDRGGTKKSSIGDVPSVSLAVARQCDGIARDELHTCD